MTLTNRRRGCIIKEPQGKPADLETPKTVAVASSLEPEESIFLFFLRISFGGGDSMNYITFEQLMQFSGVVLSLVTTIFVILSFNKKK